MFASFCIREITSFDSTIAFLGATPAALEANPKDSLICFLGVDVVRVAFNDS